MKKYIASLYDHEECLEIEFAFEKFNDSSLFVELFCKGLEYKDRSRTVSLNVCYAEEES